MNNSCCGCHSFIHSFIQRNSP